MYISILADRDSLRSNRPLKENLGELALGGDRGGGDRGGGARRYHDLVKRMRHKLVGVHEVRHWPGSAGACLHQTSGSWIVEEVLGQPGTKAAGPCCQEMMLPTVFILLRLSGKVMFPLENTYIN